jgi:hypothetical protein
VELLGELEGALQQALESAGRFAKRKTNDCKQFDKSRVDAGFLAPLLSEMNDLLKQNKLTARRKLPAISEALNGGPCGAQVMALETAVGNLDYKSARDALEKVAITLGIVLGEDAE